jgi:hypothetical protein
MAQEPPSGRPPDTTQILEEFAAAEKEVTATAASHQAPTRPEGHPSESASPGWTNDSRLDAQERSAFRMNKWVNRPHAEHNASIEAKEAASNDWAKEIAEAAKERADAAAAPSKGKDDHER